MPQASAVCGFYGYSHTAGGYDGGQAELVRVPMADVGPTVIPADLDGDDAVGCEAAGRVTQTVVGHYMKLQAGAATVLHWAINSVRKAGTVSIVGVCGPTFNAVPIGNAINKGLTLRMNQASVKRHLPRLIERIQAGRISQREIITHRVPLEEVGHAHHIFSSKRDNCIKTILAPPGAPAQSMPQHPPLLSVH